MAGSSKRDRYGTSLPDPCSTLAFDATVNSPQPTALAALRVGDVLDVSLANAGQGAVVTRGGTIVGALTGTRVAQLINCMNSGFTFSAIVRVLNGGQCVVRIEPK